MLLINSILSATKAMRQVIFPIQRTPYNFIEKLEEMEWLAAAADELGNDEEDLAIAELLFIESLRLGPAPTDVGNDDKMIRYLMAKNRVELSYFYPRYKSN